MANITTLRIARGTRSLEASRKVELFMGHMDGTIAVGLWKCPNSRRPSPRFCDARSQPGLTQLFIIVMPEVTAAQPLEPEPPDIRLNL